MPSFKGILFAFTLLSVVCLSYGGDTPASSNEVANPRHSLAVTLTRLVNTEEVAYLQQYGKYGTWADLVSEPDFMNKGGVAVRRSSAQPSFVTRARSLDFMLGWRIRLHVSADGQSYDLRLEDTTDKQCGYASISDESGIIRQSKAIDCEI
jgi:hypothetical protein